jgi:formylglycine-generating enzyme required for sulfatase activity
MTTYRTVFISYSHLQADIVERLKQALRGQGIHVWIDHESLTPGTRSWQDAIRQGIQAADVVLYMASPEALASNNVQGELDVAEDFQKPVIPIWVAGDRWVQAVPLTMTRMQHIDARGGRYAQAVQELWRTLGISGVGAAAIPVPVPIPHQSTWEPIFVLTRLDGLGFQGWHDQKTGARFIIPPVCPVAAGKFTMGSAQDDPQAFDDEKPQYNIPVGAFEIGTYPVTVTEYALAVQAGAVPAPQDLSDKRFTWAAQQQRPDHPVVGVTWENARDYCRWLAQVTGQPWRLPTEAEWEKAARGTDGRVYPWGNQWDKARANTSDGGPGGTTEVGHYAQAGTRDPKGDASPCGAHDMAGNVWEWTSTVWYGKPPYDAAKYENDSDNIRVLRGGSWNSGPRDARAAVRDWGDWTYWGDIRGFRVARGRVGW